MPTAVTQNEYICLFPADTKQGNFDTNGSAILCPSKCEITEELNGGYSLTMEHPVDEDGIWRNVQPFNILKVQGQLFTIMNAEPNYTGNSGKINVYAEHVFYKQNDEWIPPKKEVDGGWEDVYISRVSVYYALSSALDECFPNERGEDYFPTFTFASDVETNVPYAEKIESGKTRCEEIFDLISEYGGELYRDNWYYSIKQRMENAQDNAFDIRVGLNLKGIKRTVDMSTFCTHFSAWDNYGNYFAVSYDNTSLGNLPVPNIIARSKNFSYSAEYESIAGSLLERDAMAYFSENLAPKITYTISMKDVRNNPDYKQYSGIRFKVGDTGRIYDERLGGTLTLKIIKTKTNGITGEVTEVTFGNVTAFAFEACTTPVPEFPEIPTIPIDPDKITLIALDENYQETETRWVYDSLSGNDGYQNWSEIIALLRADSDIFYKLVIGDTSPGLSGRSFVSGKRLYSVYLGEVVSSLPANAFEDCNNLTVVEYTDNLKTFNNACFYGCGITSFEIPAGTTVIPASMFYNCVALAQVTIPDSVTTIGGLAFGRNYALKSITIPANVTTIYSDAFLYCSGITITIQKAENSISGSPWSASNATIIWTG